MNDWEYYNRKGIECFSEKKYLDAIQWFEKGLAITQAESSLYYNIGNTYLNMTEINGVDRIREAIDYLSKACQMEHVGANYCLAKIYDKKLNIPFTSQFKNNELALKHYKEYVYGGETASLYSACNNISVIYDTKKQYIEALCWSYYAQKSSEDAIYSKNYNAYLGLFRAEIKEDIKKALTLINNVTDVEIVIACIKDATNEIGEDLYVKENDVNIRAAMDKPKAGYIGRIIIGVILIIVGFIISGVLGFIVGIFGVILVGVGIYWIVKINEIVDSYYNDRPKFNAIMDEFERKEQEKLQKLEAEKRLAIESQNSSVPWAIRYMIEPCPYCGHYKVRYAKWEDKSLSVAFWGIASDKIGKNYKCEYCGKMW